MKYGQKSHFSPLWSPPRGTTKNEKFIFSTLNCIKMYKINIKSSLNEHLPHITSKKLILSDKNDYFVLKIVENEQKIEIFIDELLSLISQSHFEPQKF